jgi:rSAM/selenodomain-associated transferase 2
VFSHLRKENKHAYHLHSDTRQMTETLYSTPTQNFQESQRASDFPVNDNLEKRTRMQFSIVVPVYNEALLIRRFLECLRKRAPEAEIIVADGGSADGTAGLATGFCDQLVVSVPNRAVQMNAGARVARGDALWFVHVDAEVPESCLNEIARILDDPNVVGGYFRIRLPRGLVYRLTDSFAHYAGILLQMRCGDHGIFCRRNAFLDIGGFPEVPLMEDVEFLRRLRRRGRVRYSHKRILASPRRYESIGRARLTLAYGLIATLYIFGVPLSKLASIYRRMCCKGRSPALSG